MATLTFAYNHARDPMRPEHLGDLIKTSLALPTQPTVDVGPTSITVTHANITTANTAAIQSIINSYVLDPAWVSPTGSPAANEAILISRAVAGLAPNATYLALASPTTAQNTAQVKALTKQVDALIRLVTGTLDSTANT